MDADDLIELLRPEPHPSEGGYFRETWTALASVEAAGLGSPYQGPRSLVTAVAILECPH